MNCKNCNNPVTGSGNVYCSDKCKNNARQKKKEIIISKKAETLSGIEGVDYIVCKWCQKKVKRVYGIHIKNHHTEKTIEDYKKEFPKEVLTCLKDKESTSKNSGLHMKEEHYRQMAKEKVLGEKNPNHKSKTSIEERQRKSPFSQSFVSYDKIKDKKQAVKDFAKVALADRLTETQIEYWLEKFGGDKIKAKESYKERQQTFSLEKCVIKYGEEIGLTKWKDRQNQWVKSLHNNFKLEGDGRSPQSIWAKNIIKVCCRHLSVEIPIKEKWISSKNNDIRCSYDFTYNKKIIEFNGDFWHANPKLFKADEIMPMLNITAHEKWALDEKKIQLAKLHGYEVLVIWESDYKKEPNVVIKKCIDFLIDE